MNETEWARFRAGDDATFQNLIRRHSAHILSVIRPYACDDDDASDLLQETWLRIYTQRMSCRSHESVLGWMMTIARNVCLAAARSARARSVREATYADTREVVSPPAASIFVHDMVAKLPPRQRDVVVLRIVEGKSTSETAQALGCAQGTVKALLHQALSTLRHKIEVT